MAGILLDSALEQQNVSQALLVDREVEGLMLIGLPSSKKSDETAGTEHGLVG